MINDQAAFVCTISDFHVEASAFLTLSEHVRIKCWIWILVRCRHNRRHLRTCFRIKHTKWILSVFRLFYKKKGMQLTKCLCTYISVSDCTDLTQAACYRTHKAIAHETFHTIQIIHTVQRYIHTYLQTYIVIHVFIIKKLSGKTMKW